MSDSIDIKVVRPYESVEAFLDGDAWTVGRSDMLLVEQGPLPPKTILHFEIALASGEVLVRGEGWAGNYAAPSNGRPGGLRVRFRRFDSDSKSLLRRALDRQKQDTPRCSANAESDDAGRGEARPSTPEIMNAVPLPTAPAGTADEASPEMKMEQPATPEPLPLAPEDCEQSGVHHRPKGEVHTPANRDELLEKLRQRSLRLARTYSGGERTPSDRIAS